MEPELTKSPKAEDLEAVETMFFEAPPTSRRGSTPPPAPVEAVGEFLGDPLADAWLR